ncbi:MAG TPA: class I SAM-dependent methyltransferase [Solirubrobacteraceae bacterium]|nr:class I SAM-dependent methyltransferase [Solirubrobacteraceae bacterium]
MNRMHNMLCSSGWWARVAEHELVPFGVDGLELGDDVLEIGPGFGATTRVLAGRLPSLSVVELDPGYCERLRTKLPNDTVTVTHGDATALPYPDARFSTVLCFTMLHHIPTVVQQDRAFAEIARVLRPGGTFAGTDTLGVGWMFKIIHIGDTLNLVDPDGLPARLERAGLTVDEVKRGSRSFRWRATKP